VGALVLRARYLQLLEFDPEPARCANPRAARHPNPCPCSPGDQRRCRRRLRGPPEEWNRYALCIVQNADYTEAAAVAHVLRHMPRCLHAIFERSLTEPTARIKISPDVAKVTIDVGIIDGPI